MTVTETARIARVSYKTVLRWIRAGCDGVRLAAQRNGHSWDIDPGALEAFWQRLTDRALGTSDAPTMGHGDSGRLGRARARLAERGL